MVKIVILKSCSSVYYVGFEVLMVVTEDYGRQGCYAVQFKDSLTFQRNVSLPSSGSKSKPSKKPAEAVMRLSEPYMENLA
jgi:hypothetical protein